MLPHGVDRDWLLPIDACYDIVCPRRETHRRVRAYPTGVDRGEWVPESIQEGLEAQGISPADQEEHQRRWEESEWPFLLRGIRFSTRGDPSQQPRIGIEWDPRLIDVNDLRRAVEFAQKEYGAHFYERHEGTFHRLIRSNVHSAKQPLNDRKAAAVVGYESGASTFQELLVEEALQPARSCS